MGRRWKLKIVRYRRTRRLTGVAQPGPNICPRCSSPLLLAPAAPSKRSGISSSDLLEFLGISRLHGPGEDDALLICCAALLKELASDQRNMQAPRLCGKKQKGG